VGWLESKRKLDKDVFDCDHDSQFRNLCDPEHIHEIDEADGQTFIAMELLEGAKSSPGFRVSFANPKSRMP
jgi:hypothetical protein